MAMNQFQFQSGLSMPEFFKLYGTESRCESALELARWPDGFCCPICGQSAHCVLRGGTHKVFQCNVCRYQTSLIAGTIFHGTKLTLTVWFLAIYLISQDGPVRVGAEVAFGSKLSAHRLGCNLAQAWSCSAAVALAQR